MYEPMSVLIVSQLLGKTIYGSDIFISHSSYIDSFQMEIPARGVINRYIAAQGPLEKTCGDFWQVTFIQLT